MCYLTLSIDGRYVAWSERISTLTETNKYALLSTHLDFFLKIVLLLMSHIALWYTQCSQRGMCIYTGAGCRLLE